MSQPPIAPDRANATFECAASDPSDAVEALWYPDCLRQAEHEVLGQDASRARTGLALSGGGVRSATFCLGVLQGLSKISRQRADAAARSRDPLLARFGFLSTVSGGGFIGGFLTQLFQRKQIRSAADVEAVLADDVQTETADAQASATGPSPGYSRHVMHWLRENGRYLAPSGTGDYLLALATVLRNWLSLQLIYASLAMIALLVMQVLRWALYFALPRNELTEVWHPRLQWAGQYADALAFSPYYFLVFALIAFAFTPVAATYWTIAEQRPRGAPWRRILLIGPGPALLIALIVYLVFRREDGVMAESDVNIWHAASLFRTAVLSVWVAMLGLHFSGAISVLRLRWKLLAWLPILLLSYIATVLDQPVGAPVLACFVAIESALDQDFLELFLICWAVFSYAAMMIIAAEQARINRYNRNDQSAWPRVPRHHLTKSLSNVLLPIAAVSLLYLIDSLGGYVYEHFSAGDNLGTILAALGSGLGGAAFAPRVFEWYQRLTAGSDRARALPLSTILALVAFALFLLWAVALAVIAHGLVWQFGRTAAAPESLLVPLGALGFLLLLATSQSFFRGFVNASSLGNIYTQRLARAYLGASNPDRMSGNIAVTEVQRHDDQVTGTDARAASRDKGAPIHLVNTCLNETLHPQMGVQQLDRKGLQLSIGPFGYCVGARHVLRTDFALPWRDEDAAYRVHEDKRLGMAEVVRRQVSDRLFHPARARESGPEGGFRPFSNDRGWELGDLFGRSDAKPLAAHPHFDLWDYIASRFDTLKSARLRPALDRTEVLPFASWVGISGAAFSTGAGFHTSLPLAMLCGFFNVRLGYWWDAGVQGTSGLDDVRSPQSHWLFRLFPVYGLLKTELSAAYTGTNARRWYLSDGGHFENLGVYELIRRRLKLIVSIDAGCDPDSGFEDLGNLVRKARIDFNTQIGFLDADELSLRFGSNAALGTLDDLRRLNRRESSDGILGNSRTSLKQAALARVDYGPAVAAADRYAWLLYIKPAVVAADLPADLAQYQIANADFPHQSTANQFFDEAQWESYRKLGEFTACRLLGAQADGRGLLDFLAETSAAPD